MSLLERYLAEWPFVIGHAALVVWALQACRRAASVSQALEWGRGEALRLRNDAAAAEDDDDEPAGEAAFGAPVPSKDKP